MSELYTIVAADFSFFNQPGQFWRGNLHTHSSRSDGALPPEEVSRRYKAMGYDFYCLSDHFLQKYDFPITDTTDHRDENFTTLIGAELHAGALANGEMWHILANGLPPDFAATSEHESGPDLARRASDAGAFVTIAHPQWYGLTLEDAKQLAFADAIEIYNHTCQVRTDRPDGAHLLDQLLAEGFDFKIVATDDAHFRELDNPNSDAFGGWVMVKAEANTPESLLQSLKAGHYYSSQGPEFRRIAIVEEEVVVECSAVSRVLALGARSRSKCLTGQSMTSWRMSLSEFADGFVRFVIVDAAGKRAWSNPVRI
jgi:hypothetical protein